MTDSLHLSISESDDFNRNKRSSISSIRSGVSVSSPYEVPSDYLSFSDEQSQMQRRPSKKTVSTFIGKLYSMVENTRHQNLISWSPAGTSFFVCNATQFAQEMLPEYFKHSNFSSFVRLLNMYGFHKINKSPRGQRGNNENEIWEFSHPKFQHGGADMLKEIKRKAMDSELLRRETGDIHASFAMLQLSQADLLQQFYILQDNFSSLLQGFEETKKVQLQQQIIIRQLAEKQGLQQGDLMAEFSQNETSSTASPLKVFVTSPNANEYNPMQFVNQPNHWEQSHQHPLQHPLQPDVSMPMYEAHNSPSSAPMSPYPYDNAINTPLPPSPISSSMMNSPIIDDHHDSPFQMNYDDVNTLHF